MEVSELMVNDWLEVISSDHLKYVQVKEIYEHSILTKEGEYESEEVDITNLRPIPLTYEILKQNGYKYVSGEKGMYGVTIAPYFKRDDSPRIYCDGDPFAVWFDEEVTIQHVHQLQHILQFCGSKKNIIL